MDMATAQQRTMKDFLELYNRLVYHCFDRCVSNFNHGKTSEEEMNCINACTDKVINFNQRHMMVFVEHQNTKQKQAAMSAGAQPTVTRPAVTEAPTAVGVQIKGAAPLPTVPSVPEQDASTLAKVATTLVGQGDALPDKETVPKNVCGHASNNVTAHLAPLPLESSSYPGKSLVDQFLDSGAEKLKFV